jgi:hypothetical protein
MVLANNCQVGFVSSIVSFRPGKGFFPAQARQSSVLLVLDQPHVLPLQTLKASDKNHLSNA